MIKYVIKSNERSDEHLSGNYENMFKLANKSFMSLGQSPHNVAVQVLAN